MVIVFCINTLANTPVGEVFADHIMSEHAGSLQREQTTDFSKGL
jgi:hypothetical protein